MLNVSLGFVSSLPPDFSIQEQLKKPPDIVIQKIISKSEIDSSLKNSEKFGESGKITPYFHEGKPSGIEFSILKQSSLLYKIGFRKEDVWLAFNGDPINFENGSTLFEIIKKNEKPIEILILRAEKFIKLIVSVKK